MTWLHRLIRVVFPRRDDAVVDEELRLHVELEAEDLIRRGVPPEDARRQALVSFGSVESVREEARDTRRLAWLDVLQFDLRHAFRSLRRTPGFTLVIVFTLAIGVGANASLYALVDSLMFKSPSGVREPERLVSANVRHYVRFLDVSEQARALHVAAYTRNKLSLGTGADAAPIHAECVTASYFPVLGAQPILGRVFSEDAAAEQREPAVILADALWRRQFDSSRAALGQRLAIGDRLFTVIGVMPRGFTGVTQEPIDAWIVLPVSPELCSFTGQSLLGSTGGAWLNAVGRLAPGVTLAQAEAEVSSIASPEELFRRALSRPAAPRRELQPLHESRRERVAKDAGLSLWLLGGAAVVLLISCANVAGLLSIRTIDRRRETSVRLQLGASRGRILRQFFIEQFLIALACGAAALAVSSGLNAVLATFFPYAVVSDGATVEIFGMAAGLAVAAALASGVVPALQVSKVQATTFSQASVFAARDRSRFRSALLVGQVALAFTLVIAGGLFVRSVQQTRQNLGYEPDGLFLIEVDLRKAGLRSPRDIRHAYEAMAEKLRAVAGIEHVGLSSGAFMDVGGAMKVRPGMPGKPDVMSTAVSPGYFNAFGAQLRRGRLLTEQDGPGMPKAAVVDESVAQSEWPGRDPIGECIFADQKRETCTRIVGVVTSRRMYLGSPGIESEVFTPMSQAGDEDVPQFMVARARDRRLAKSTIAAAAGSAIPAAPHVGVHSFDDVADEQTRSWRLGQTLFGLFAIVGVFLSALGLYSVLALAGRQRTTEIGVRMALGARPIDIARLVLRHAATFVGIGWVAGLAMAFASTQYIEKLLFQISATDAATFASASLVVVLAGAAGCALPAIRAARLSPVKALRHE
jgi:predicted permease